MKILHVEDESFWASIVQRICLDREWDYSWVETVHEAVQLLNQGERYDFVLIDGQTSDSSAERECYPSRALANRLRDLGIPCCFLSASEDPRTDKNCTPWLVKRETSSEQITQLIEKSGHCKTESE